MNKVFIVRIVTLFAFLFIMMKLNFYWWSGEPYPGDWRSLMVSGQAISEGKNPYLSNEKTPLIPAYDRYGNSRDMVLQNLNPPAALFLFQIIAGINVQVSYWIWFVFSFLLFLTCIYLLLRSYPSPDWLQLSIWALSSTFFLYVLMVGQIYIQLAFISILAWLGLKNKQFVLAGCLIGLLIAIKPNFVIWPTALFLIGYYKTAIISGITFLMVSGFSALVYGINIFPDWFKVMGSAWWVNNPINMSIIGLLDRLNFTGIEVIVTVLIIIGFLAFVFWLRPPWEDVSGLSLAISLFISPFAWVYYAVFLLPVYLTRKWTLLSMISASCFLFPASLVFFLGKISPTMSIFMGLIYYLGLLFILIDLILHSKRSKKGSILFEWLHHTITQPNSPTPL